MTAQNQVPAGPSSSAVRAVWAGPLLVLVAAWVVITLLFRDTAAAMVTIWYRSETFNHCFVVPPIALWLAWRQWPALVHQVPRPSPWMLVPLFGLVLMWLLGDLVAVNSVTQLALVAMWVLAVPLLLGVRVAWVLLFPLAFMFFSVPLGEFLLPQLMESTADFTVWALRLSGIPVHREGLQFVIPSGNWSVVEACSGVRYLIASSMVGALFAYLNYRSTKRRFLFVLVSLVVPVVANWLRAYMIVMLGHLSGNKLAVGVDHLIYGWVFFGVVILLMFLIGARWSEPEWVPEAPARGMLVGEHRSSARFVLAVWMAALVVLAMPTFARWALDHGRLAGTPALVLPAALDGDWRQQPAVGIGYTPIFRNPSTSDTAVYEGAAGQVHLYVAYYRNQDYDRKLVSSDNVLVASHDTNWARSQGGVQSVTVEGRALPVRSVELRRLQVLRAGQPQRLVVWQLYWIDGTWTHSDYLAKLYGVWNRLQGRGDESAAVVVYAPLDGPEQGENPLPAFVAANLSKIDALLRQARANP